VGFITVRDRLARRTVIPAETVPGWATADDVLALSVDAGTVKSKTVTLMR